MVDIQPPHLPHTVRTTRSNASAKYRRFLLFSPAIEIRPFAVRYTCASSTNALDCAVEIPVKLRQQKNNISEMTHLRLKSPNAPEHSDLIDDMVPVPRRLELIGQHLV